MTSHLCPGCRTPLADNVVCASCGGEAVEPARASAMRAALGEDAFKNVVGTERHCAFCDAIMVRQQIAAKVTVDVCSACAAWFLDRGERDRLGALAEAKARGEKIVPDKPKSKRVAKKVTPKWMRALQIVGGALLFAFVMTCVGFIIWGSVTQKERYDAAHACKTECDCTGDYTCNGGACSVRFCKTGLLSVRGCGDGYRCVETRRFISKSDRRFYDGVCQPRSEASCRVASP